MNFLKKKVIPQKKFTEEITITGKRYINKYTKQFPSFFQKSAE